MDIKHPCNPKSVCHCIPIAGQIAGFEMFRYIPGINQAYAKNIQKECT
jgi:hypothetical protein